LVVSVQQQQPKRVQILLIVELTRVTTKRKPSQWSDGHFIIAPSLTSQGWLLKNRLEKLGVLKNWAAGDLI
jgi:hypothetical protein